MESEQKKKENIALPQSNHDFDKNQEEIQIHESQRRYGEEGCRLAFLDILRSNCQIYSVDLKKGLLFLLTVRLLNFELTKIYILRKDVPWKVII